MDASFTIISGQVEYEHKKPRADYENVTPKVSLSFTVAEGSDPGAVAAKVMLMAVEIVEAAAGGKLVVELKPVDVIVPAPKTTKRPVPTPEQVEAAMVEEVASVDAAAIENDDDLLGITAEMAEVAIADKDLQALAMSLRAPLTAKHGNMGKLRVLIQEAGGGSVLTSIPVANRAAFIEKAKGLLASL